MQDRSRMDAAVVFADGFFMSESCLAEIAKWGGYVWANAGDQMALAQKIGGSDQVKIIVSEYVPIGEKVFQKAPGLRGIIAYGAGYDHIDVKGAFNRGIQVCNCRGENAQAVAEHTFGLLLSLVRRIHQADAYVRQNHWTKAASSSLPDWSMGEELWRKTLGVIGLGQIGSRVARIARGFEMKVLAYDPWAGLEGFPWIEKRTLEALLAESDMVTLHVPFTRATEKMINADALCRMKKTAILVNTSRGRVIDESALIAALKEGRLGGAALDVFEREPLSGKHPLVQLDNVVLSPHIGAMTREAGERLSAAVTRQVMDILAGRKPECLIEP